MLSLFLVIFLFIPVFIWIRNVWVYKNRIKLLRDDYETYQKLPSYHQMMFKFWVWNINKFIKD